LQVIYFNYYFSYFSFNNYAYEYTPLDSDTSWLLLCSPLFFILQALVDINIVDGDLDIVDDAILHIVSIFRAIRKVEDGVDAQMTTVNFFTLFFINFSCLLYVSFI